MLDLLQISSGLDPRAQAISTLKVLLMAAGKLVRLFPQPHLGPLSRSGLNGRFCPILKSGKMALSSYPSASNQAMIERVKTRFLASYAIGIRVFKSFEITLTL